MEDYTKPDSYILYVGTNNLSLDDTPEVISSRIKDTAKSLMTEEIKIIISNIVAGGDKYKEKGEVLSKVINDAYHEEKNPVINHNSIDPKKHLNTEVSSIILITVTQFLLKILEVF